MDDNKQSDWKKEWKNSGLDPDNPEDFKKIQDIYAKKMEAEQLGSVKTTPSFDTIKSFTDIEKSLSTDGITNSKGMKNMMGNPILSSVMKQNPKRNQSQSESNQQESTKIDGDKERPAGKKDPELNTITPGSELPLKSGDSETNILAKIYNLMIKRFNDDIEFEDDTKKFREKLTEKKENRSEELIGLFTEKKKKTFKTKPKKEEIKKKPEEPKKGITAEKVPSVQKPSITSTITKGAVIVGGAGLATAVMSHESKGSADAYNYYKGSTNSKSGNIKNLKGVINDAGTGKGDDTLQGKKISDLTVAEIQNLQNQGKLYAVGKWQMIPSTIDDMVSKLKIDPTKQKFDDSFQNKLFSDYFATYKRPVIGKYLRGEPGVSRDDAVLAVAQEWSSVGVPRDIKAGELGNGYPKQNLKKGDSFYKGGGDVSATSPNLIAQELDKAKGLKSNNTATMTPTQVSEIPSKLPNNKGGVKTTAILQQNNNTNVVYGDTVMSPGDSKNLDAPLIEKQYNN